MTFEQYRVRFEKRALESLSKFVTGIQLGQIAHLSSYNEYHFSEKKNPEKDADNYVKEIYASFT